MADDYGVFRFPMAGPDDVAPLARLVDKGELDPRDVVAIIGKTEGNGRVNDFTRGFATFAFEVFLAERLGVTRAAIEERVALVMSGGCEGVMSPHATALTRRFGAPARPAGEGRLAVGVAFTRDLLPEEMGTAVQARLVAEAVRRAMKEVGIASPEDVHYVQTKGPVLTPPKVAEAGARGRAVVTTDMVRSFGFSNGSSALGVGIALGEVPEEAVADAAVGVRTDLFCSVASCSAGIEIERCAVVVLGNSPLSASRYRIGHGVMQDSLDIAAVGDALRGAGIPCNGLPVPAELRRIAAVFAKGGIAANGEVRGRRTTPLTDSDIGTRHLRAAVNAVIAAVIGDPMVYVSAGWSPHQGPLAGGPVAVIAQVQ
jgi:cyanuric acid amidohydrolase